MPDDVTATTTDDAGLGDGVSEPTSTPEFTGAEGAPPTEPSTFDWSAYGDQHVAVKVNGEELRVPLSEAIAGYQRTADYTQKTQALASERQQLEYAASLAAALERNPKATLEFLAQTLKVPFGAEAADDTPEFLTPEEQKIAELEAQLSELQGWRQENAIERELAAVRSQYGDFDTLALLKHAAEIDAPNLETAYKDMKFNELQQELQTFKSAEQQLAEQRAAAEAAATEAKRGASALVTGGHGVAPGATAPASKGRMTLREAFYDAWDKHGV
jgi:hypothetical protein